MKTVFYVVLVVIVTVAVLFGLCVLTNCIMPLDDAQAMTIEVPDDGIIFDNLIDNVDFSSDQFMLLGTDYRQYGYTFGGWYFNYTDNYYSDVYISTNGIVAQLGNESIYRANLRYDFPADFFQSYTTYTITFGMDVISSPWFGVGVEKRNQNTYGASLGGRSWSSFTSGVQPYSLTFTTGTIDPTFIYCVALKVDPTSVMNLYYIKVESSSSFTGFVPKSYKNYGYDQGLEEGRAGAKDYWVNEVESYLDGNVVYGSFYDYNDVQYMNVLIENGDTFNYPNSDFTGSGFIAKDYSGYGGLLFQNISGQSTWTIREFIFNDVVPGFYGHEMCAFVMTALPGTRVHFSGAATKDFTFGDLMTYLIVLELDSNASLNISLTDPNASVNILKYLTAYSKYFTGWPVDGVNSDAYAQGYYDGATGGYEAAKSAVWDSAYYAGQEYGYTNGYSDGYGEGRITGYSDGLTDAGDGSNGTWYSLFTSIIDVPIKTIVGFLDVQIFGFNFLSLFRTLILVSLFFFVLKVLVGKYA